ncbi:hypothetical protein PMPD1_2480 [Paramixta manurensis]|uniref:Antitermination protein n=1 Tax=Paramixta manurensis TaxID=2740817 RepID=A0A6M8UKM3_9GAMM|nr:hypothetical protein PMPD1_2480 [Erwiniaceae bacterium PD-1]
MTKAIEQIIRMHDPRCLSAESSSAGRGKSPISRDQIIGAMAATQREHPVGYDILLTKYRADYLAEQRLRAAVSEWLHERPHPERAIAACNFATSMVLGRNLPAQCDRIAALMRKYSPKALMTRKTLDAIEGQRKHLELQRLSLGDSDVRYAASVAECADLTARITAIRGELRAWSSREATKTCLCPRCRGTGSVSKPHPAQCDECGGRGSIPPTMELMRKSMKSTGAEVRSAVWAADYAPVVEACQRWLYIEESSAEIFLSERLRNEIQPAA